MQLRLAFLLALLGCALLPSHSLGYLIGDNGPEGAFVEVKQSVRRSADFDAQLRVLAMTESRLGLTVVARYVGPTYLDLVSFPGYFTEAQALAALDVLQKLRMVERTTPVSFFNLIYRSGDIGQEFGPNEFIPEAVRRGLDSGPTPAFDPSVVLVPHAPRQLIVSWKPEFIWNAAQTGFLQKIAAFNASLGCHVVEQLYASGIRLEQVLEFSGPDSLLADKLQRYLRSGWVEYAEPNFLVFGDGAPSRPPTRVRARSVPARHVPVRLIQRGTIQRQVN